LGRLLWLQRKQADTGARRINGQNSSRFQLSPNSLYRIEKERQQPFRREIVASQQNDTWLCPACPRQNGRKIEVSGKYD